MVVFSFCEKHEHEHEHEQYMPTIQTRGQLTTLILRSP